MPFKPGQSGNPKGRPPFDRKVRDYLDGHTRKALVRLWRLTASAKEEVALGALTVFLRKCLPDLKQIDRTPLGAKDGEARRIYTDAEIKTLIEARKLLDAGADDSH